MAKKRKSAFLEEDIIFCWFCEREFNDSMVLITHQKAKHFTCHLCQKKLNSVSGLVGHLKSMHKDKLDSIPNALPQKADPEKCPEITGMDGIPELDYEDFKTRRQQPLVPPLPSIPPAPGTTPTAVRAPGVESNTAPGTVSKKAKIDTPLDEGTIQAQLAEFQKKKEEEQVKHLICSGIVLPPGVAPNLVLHKFPSVPPPGEGLYAATKLPAAFASATSTSAASGLEGKSLDSTTVPSSNISSSSLSNPSNPNLAAANSNPNISTTANPNSNTSNATSNATAVKDIKMAPPPSLKFTKTETILTLSPPTPLPLAPGQKSHPGVPSPRNSVSGQAGMAPQMGGQGYNPGLGMGPGGMGRGMQQPFMGQNMGRGFNRGGRMQPLAPPQYPPQPYGRGMAPVGRGQFPYPPPPPPPQPYGMTPSGQYNQFNRGRSGPRNMNMGGRFPQQAYPPPPVVAPPPLHLTPQGYTPYSGPVQTPQAATYPPPPPAPAPYGYPSQQGQYKPPVQAYGNYGQPAQTYPPTGQGFPPRVAQQQTPSNVPFEVLYPMHGKRAPAFTPPATPTAGIPPAMSPNAPPGMPLPPQSMSPTGYQHYAQSASAGQSAPGGGFFAPPLPTSPPPMNQGSMSPGGQVQGQGQGGRVEKLDVRIISDDFVSPEEKLAAKYGYGRS